MFALIFEFLFLHWERLFKKLFYLNDENILILQDHFIFLTIKILRYFSIFSRSQKEQ